jgi:arylsulfatase A-like enzyme
VPLILAGPGFGKDVRISAPVYAHDIVPTSLDLAGAATPEHVAFRSLLPQLRGDTGRRRGAIYGAYMNLQRMLVSGDFKLIWYPEAGVTRLFNFEKDPWEMHDLAAEPQYRDVVVSLQSSLAQVQEEMGDPGPRVAAPALE